MKKNLIVFSAKTLGILAILAVALVATVPNEAKAQYKGYVNRYREPNMDNITRPSVTTYNPSSGVPIYSGLNTNNYVTYVPYNPKSNSTSTVAKKTTTSNTKAVASKESVSDLAANAIFGSDGFMPSGLTQWILVAILIVLLIIITRKVFGKQAEYMNTPLKSQ